MIVSRAQRLLFVHVQKTGGLSTDTLLESLLPDAERVQGLPGTRHAKLRAALRAHPEYADYFVFGFVRNPWARLLSWHAMVLRRTSSAQDGNEYIAARLEANSFWRKVGEEYADFEEFVLRGTREIPRLGTPQIDWLRAPGREADFIGRTESFDADLATALEKAGVEVPPGAIQRRNAGPPADYRSAYTPAMRDRVAEAFAEDIEAFGYRF
ncbi:sulfotransferase family 2 domain-containing protein [Nocardioides campestrisoli]|uniref:sulfotransferase family 2 domain-containing protein n=1 Tax=Nocardioides campestrisoli TaxID=2736757 RepID=UPI0015E7AD2A|nr:sulfotransferase family 2 domain-containing protein [Nocardioides campestrisoli]